MKPVAERPFMPRVIFINRYYFPDHSATSQLLTDLTVYLARRGYQVHVVTSRQLYDDPAAQLPAEDTFGNVIVHRLSTSRLGRGSLWGRALDYVTFYGQALLTLARLVQPGDCLLAKTDPPLISVCAALVARWKQAHLINWVQDLFPEVACALGVTRDGMGYRLLRRMRNWSLHQAVRNVVLGERMHSLLRQEGIAPSALATIHNWADGRAIVPIEHRDNPLRRDWQLGEKFVIGYSGNMGRAHEFDTLLGAAERLIGVPDIQFLLIGDGAQRARLEAAVRARGLTNIQFQPYQPRERLAYSLGAADVHLVSLAPSLEGLIVPSKFYGIAAAGRATLFIGDPHGEIAQLIARASCGATVPVGDAIELAAQIRSCAADRQRTTAMGRRARQLFQTSFDQPHALAAWEALLSATLTDSGLMSLQSTSHPYSQDLKRSA